MPLGERIELAYGKGLREGDRKSGEFAVFGSNGPVGTNTVALVDGPGILVGRKGTVGAVHFSPRPFWPIDTVYYVVPRTGDDMAFVRHLLDYMPLRLLNAATGVPGLSRRDAYALRGAFPPLDEQLAIARILDAVDLELQLVGAAVHAARSLDHSLLHDLMEKGLSGAGSGSGSHPEHWIVRRVDEVAEVGSGVTLGKNLSGFRCVELPYLRVANVQDGHLDLSTIKTVRVRATEANDYRLESGDVLMTEGGDLDKLGRGTIWEGQVPDCLHQNHIFRIRANPAVLLPEFYALVVESDIAKRYFNRVAKQTTNLASTNKTQVRAFTFPLPPTLEEQRQIVTMVRAAKAALSSHLAAQEVLFALKRSLMHDLLTGRTRLIGHPGSVS